MGLEDLFTQYTLLAGVAAFITAVVNALKRFGVVQDGQAPTLVFVLNLIGFVLFVLANLVGFRVGPVDTAAGVIANFITGALGFIVQISASKVAHHGLKRSPVIGYSYSAERGG